MPKADKSSTEQQTLSRTLSFLNMMASTGQSLSVTEIADKLDVSKPTAYAIVNTLTAQNFLEKDSESGKLHIGYAFYVMGPSYQRQYPFLIYTEEHVLHLHEKYGMRVSISVFKPPMKVLVIAAKERGLVPRHLSGCLMPAHVSASGKLLLAYIDGTAAWAYISGTELAAFTGNTITASDALMEELARIRAQGYALDNEEFVPGNICVAAPIFDASGTVQAALSLSRCPVEKFRGSSAAIIQDVKNAALQISYDLGCSRDVFFSF